ncbi:MAG: Fic family protein [Vogesella sp.]|uniref:Fic family protein n=1 Tax=Vogesella sp. TaxID=1904252 RepID=UPI003F3387F1
MAILAIVHTQFEARYPFNDGNGRVGRILMRLMLVTPCIWPVCSKAAYTTIIMTCFRFSYVMGGQAGTISWLERYLVPRMPA